MRWAIFSHPPPYDNSGHEAFIVNATTSNGSSAFVSFAGDPQRTNRSFNGLGNAFNIFMNTGPPPTQYDYSFQPDCNANTSQGIYLKWSNARVGWSPSPGGPYDTSGVVVQQPYIFEQLEQFSPNGTFQAVVPGSSATGSEMGTQPNQEVSWPSSGGGLILTAGDKYIWQWTGVDQGHAIQIIVPYSSNSYDAGIQCSVQKGYDGQSHTSVAPGQIDHMWHWVNNQGPNTATYTWEIQGNYHAKGNLSGGSWTNLGSSYTGTNTVPAGGNCPFNDSSNGDCNSPGYANNYTFPSGATPNVSIYCQRIAWEVSGSSKWQSSSGECVKLTSASTTPTVQVSCSDTYAYDPASISYQTPTSSAPSGYHWYQQYTSSDTVSSRTVVSVGNNSAAAPNNSDGAYVNNGKVGVISSKKTQTSGNWSYAPTQATIYWAYINKEKLQEVPNGKAYSSSDPYGWATYGGSSGSDPCYSSACTISVTGDGPNNVVEAGGPMYVTASVTNTSPSGLPLPASIEGHLLQLNNGDASGGGSSWGFSEYPGGLGGIPPGATIPVSFTLTAPGSATPYADQLVAHTAYSNLFAFGSGCSTTVDVYVHFQLNPSATSQFPSGEDPEDPTKVNYNTSMSSNISTPVQVPLGAEFYYSPSQSSAQYALASSPYQNYDIPPTATPLSGTYTIGQPLVAGNAYCSSITYGFTSGWVGPGGPTDLVGQAGGGTTTSSPCAVVVNKPYFKVYGNGVSANGIFSGGTCSNGVIAGYNNNSLGSYNYGAGSELSNIATCGITGYASGQTIPYRPPPDINFANSSGTVSFDAYTPQTGGDYYAPTPAVTAQSPINNAQPLPSCSAPGTLCTPSFGGGLTYKKVPSGWRRSCTWTGRFWACSWKRVWKYIPVFVPASIPSGDYTYTGNVVLNSMSIQNGTNFYLNVNGNVYIKGNITYAGANNGSWTVNSPSSTSNIPSFILNATGNIYIDPGVGTLDGLYIASAGKIYTCGQQSGDTFSPMPAANLYNSCNQQLTVHGSFEAQSVNLMRTYGSLRNETPAAPSSGIIYGSDYSSCAPISPPAWGNLACADAGNSVYNYQEYAATYSLGLPADSGGYTLNLNYQNKVNTIYGWPPPTIVNYYYIVQVYINGSYVKTLNLPPSGGPYSSNLGYTGAVNTLTLKWINNGWPAATGTSTSGPGTDQGFIPWNGDQQAYDPNFEINSLQVGSTVITPPQALNCSNNGGTTSSRSTCAAEVFDFSPEYYLSSPLTEQTNQQANSAMEIYNLPPVL